MARQLVDRRPLALFGAYILPVLAYLAVIFTLSAQPHLRPPVDFVNADKIYHVLEYGGLGWLIARMLSAVMTSWVLPRRLIFALGLGLAIAIADEMFQRTVPGRESSPFDAMADGLGVMIAQFLWLRGVRPRGLP